MKKTLAIVLSILALLSVMTLVAYAINSAEATQYAADDMTVPSDTTGTTGTTEPTNSSWLDKFADFWASFYPIFDSVYKGGFVVLTQILSWIVSIVLGSVFA